MTQQIETLVRNILDRHSRQLALFGARDLCNLKPFKLFLTLFLRGSRVIGIEVVSVLQRNGENKGSD